jgi:outer membrane protein OmpA-like peptidoglycan-associated protein
MVAHAQVVNGPYIGLGAGVNMMQREHATFSGGGGSSSGDAKVQLGPAVVGSIGYGFGNGLRAELEGNWRYNTFSGTTSGTSVGGKEQKFGGMVNVLYDFNLSPMFMPYVGVGAGYEAVKEQNFHATTGGAAITVPATTKGAFAYQAILGAAMPIPNAPGLAVTAEYRFMGLAGDRTYGGSVTTGGGTFPATVKATNDYNHTLLVGIRYNFGQAPAPMPAAAPAPMPAPAVQPARSYLVFFDWDKATLTDRARQIIKEAADNSTHVQYTRIEVNGYTDTSGTPQYNQGLSVRRAQAVAAELVHDGVPTGAITAQGFGDTHLLVPTGPGVREPQNRRVEIVIH